MNIDDTIVAISTTAGTAARAIVRLSGPKAIDLAGGIFLAADTPLADLPGFTSTDGLLRLARDIDAPCRAYLFREPRSYTRQNIVELHIPGVAAVATAAVDELIGAGARGAEAGEFTARAFFSGRIDLSAAEAVADVIDAAGAAQLRSAAAAVDGQIHRLCRGASRRLADILAGVEASIDLADEDIDLDDPSELARRLSALAAELTSAQAEAADMPDTADRPHVVIAGLTNVGKSSLLNALSGSDRAIVSALAGTTRDVLSAAMTLDSGQAVTLQDAAGFTGSDESLASAADSAARRAVASADAIIFVFDAARLNASPDCPRDLSAEMELLDEVVRVNPRAPRLLTANKIDLCDSMPEETLDAISDAGGDRIKTQLIAISCVTGEGLDRLWAAMADELSMSAVRDGQLLGLHQRQRRHLAASAEAAERAADLLAQANSTAEVAELAAVELRDCLSELGRISGQVVTDDILAKIFSRFCVGK